MKKILLAVLPIVLLLAMMGNGYVTSDRLTHYVVLTFDDGTQAHSSDRSVAIMNSFGYKGVVFLPVVTVEAQGATVYVNLQKSGWEIGSHTWDHVSVDALSAARLTFEIVNSKAWLEKTFGVKVISFDYPNSRGEANQTVSNVLASAGYLYARGDNWNEEADKELPRWTGGHSFAVTSYPVTDHEPNQGYVSQMANVLHDANTYGIAVAMFHAVDASASGWGGLTPAEFTWCLQQVQKAGLQVVTFQQWEQIRYGTPPPESPPSQVTVNITFQPFNFTMQYELVTGTVWAAPSTITMLQRTYTFNRWNDGSTNPARTFVNNGNYQITYT
jgi:peptidoglycan/xylan/chitin deacetylase (PgdA/CDA1 family)